MPAPVAVEPTTGTTSSQIRNEPAAMMAEYFSPMM